ncbi:iron-containing alcohol dehydrogenase [Porphyromonas gingivalis]|uniref:Iron-containing alcohol dehydrogenase n=1 Tax=Porphyromonas gingivalis TaxID=837 RepID=A0AAE9XHS8_PORGN|nr:iron-containing alcohol dehydrogenase [Porphyromonas gingivalis]ERJ87072.1 alcohol dehydrogenase, iron-dependent [Porphyromonas gingivalis F0566]WCG02355.1 iron-containing alcohol dehydrogenase [Porphyromonas gingivalis]SJL28832.1 alcohol dehydrogenase [Porphyromonas gingivalis]
MNNFKFKNPTELIFGQGMIKELPKRVPAGVPVLVTFGSGSVRYNGVYRAVKDALEGYDLVEFWGIESNPKIETLRKAIAMGKEHNCQFVLAVGGGSVIDGSKLIAAAIPYEGDAWELVLKGYSRDTILPLGTVLTIPATGSEMNSGAIISREETKEKLVFRGNFPVFSILDPEVTFSLPPYQIACGLADSFVHVIEQYITTPGQSRLMDRWAESIMLTLKEIAPLIRENPHSYDLMADFMLCATMALNGFIAMGVTQDWATHMIGHEITALTGLTHGHTLAIVLPGTLRTLGHDHKREKMLQYAERIWDIKEGMEEERIDAAIARTEEFFRELGLKTRLEEMHIGSDVIKEIERRFIERGVSYGEALDVDGPMARRILEACR